MSNSIEWPLVRAVPRVLAASREPVAASTPAMRPEQLQQLRAERLIAVGRVVLAVAALVALWFDPSEPARYATTAYALVAAYAAYSALLAAAVWSAEASSPLAALVTHGFDLAAFAVVLFFSEGATSPFFAFFVFALVSGALRWQARGTAWTAAVALGAFLGIGLWSAWILPQEGFELNRFIIRSVYLAVVAALLGSVGHYETRVRGELSRLAVWARRSPESTTERHFEIVAHAAETLGMPRALLLWEEPEQPGQAIVTWMNGGAGELDRVAPGGFEPPVAPALANSSFLVSSSGGKAVLRLVSGGFERWHGGAALHPGLRERLGAGPVLALCLRPRGASGAVRPLFDEGHDDAGGRRRESAAPVRGWLFLAGRHMTGDDLLLGEVVGGIAAAEIEQREIVDHLARAAVMEERMRLARDLHDGVIQALTGATLHLETARRLVDRSPREAESLLAETAKLLAAEQRELREFVSGELTEGDFGRRLADLADRSERTWGIEVDLEWKVPRGAMPAAAAREVYRIVQEALVNAARHGRASRVEVAGRMEAEGAGAVLHLSVADDGCGFPLAGSYDGDALESFGEAPKTIRQRVERLRGNLSIESGSAGAKLTMELPLQGEPESREREK